MKQLTLLRHAKSSWKNHDLIDIKRPLNKRGKRDAPLMAKIISQRLNSPDLFLTSPAKRARTTAKIIAKEMGFSLELIKIVDNIYRTDAGNLNFFISKIENQYKNIIICGHNPSLTDLLNLLISSFIENIPTCGIATIRFSIEKWQDIALHKGELIYFDFPKKHY